MNDILWVKVSDEVGIPSTLGPAEEAKLKAVFDGKNPSSPWNLALARLGMDSALNNLPVLRFVGGVPFFNGSLLAWVSSHGTVLPRPGEGGSVKYEAKLGLFGLFRLLVGQWKLEVFLKANSGHCPPLVDSIALGLAIQSLMQRLPAKSERELAAWLASPAAAPAGLRSTVEKVLVLQKRRNALSPHWQALFPRESRSPGTPELPAHFWNEPSGGGQASALSSAFLGGPRKGIPICSGQVEAELLLIEENQPAGILEGGPYALLFPRARPETTEQFGKGVAILFGEGGALSHACSVARETGVTCVSGLGRDVVQAARLWKTLGKKAKVRVDGASGEVVFHLETL